MIIRKNAKLCLVAFLVLLLNIFYLGEKRSFCAETKKEIIQKYFISHKEYPEFPNKNIFMRIIPGEWGSPPHSKFYFYENGDFVLECYEFGYVKKRGKWAIKDNRSLWLLFSDRGVWEENKIEAIIYKESKDKDILRKYSIEILFKEGKFWGESLWIDFD